MRNQFAIIPTLAAAALSQTAVAIDRDEVVSTVAVEFPEVSDNGDVAPDFNELNFESAGKHATEISIQAPSETQWNSRAQRRFNGLAVKEAIGTITSVELEELERLTRDRERTDGHLSSQEVIHQIRAHQVTRDLIAAIERYVEVFSTHIPHGARHPKAQTER
jgi:hypothetical protein